MALELLQIILWIFGVAMVGLTVKLWQYRAAIIRLQADMTLVLNELTKPTPGISSEMMVCNQCDRMMGKDYYAQHRCVRAHTHAV